MQGLRFYANLKYISALFFFIFSVISKSSNTLFCNDDPYIIVIDAGHGGKDIGTSGEYLIEKDATLDIALELGQKLTNNRPDVLVKYTRQTDEFLPVYKRVALANEIQADLFISIHCNSVKGHNPHGIETYVLGVQNNDENQETVNRENESILYEDDFNKHYDGFDPNSPSGNIYLSAVRNQFLNEGILLAHQIQTEFSSQNIMRDRGVKQAGFVVLKKAKMPAILLEVGFLSNKNDERKLANAESRSQIISQISSGITKYVDQQIKENRKAIVYTQPVKIVRTEEKRNLKTAEVKAVSSEKFNIILASSANGELTHLIQAQILDKKVNAHIKEGIIEYSIGPYDDLGNAISAQNKVRLEGFKGAYVTKVKKEFASKQTSDNQDVSLKYAGVN